MVVPNGYKKTEIGVIPEDWEVLKLSEIATLINGRAFKQQELLKKGKYVVLRVGNFFTNNSWYYSDLELEPQFYVENGDLMYAWSASFGPKFWRENKCIYHYHIWKVIPHKITSKEYLYHIFDFDKTSLLSHSQGGTMFHLTKLGMEERLFPFPSLKEQTAIAEALSDMDALITRLEQQIEKKKAIKQGMMQELLKPKEGWVTKKLGDLGRTYGGLTGKSKVDFKDGNCSYIPFMNIMSDPIINTENFDRVKIMPGEKQNKAQKGDLFFNGSSETPEEVGMCSVLTEDIENLYLNSFCFGFRFHDNTEVNRLFLAYFFRSSFGRNLIFSLAQGATRYNLSKTNLLKLELQLPDITEQEMIANIIKDNDGTIHMLKLKLDKLKLQKQAMMQSLLTGKIRLI